MDLYRSGVELIQPKCIAVGKHKPIELSEQEHAMVCNIGAAGQLESVRSFKRIRVNGHTVCSKEYSSRSSRRNNSIIAYKRGAKTGYGRLLKFIECSFESSNECHHLAMVERLDKLATTLMADTITNGKLQHIQECQATTVTELITCDTIIAPVIVIHVQDHMYVAQLPNRTEIDL